MGCVAYDIDVYDFDNLIEEEKSFLRSGVELDFPIGALKVTASREELQITESVKKAIKQKTQEVVKEIVIECNKTLAACKTLYDAKLLWHNVFRSSPLHNIILKQAEWNGIKLENNVINFMPNVSGLTNYTYSKYRGRRGTIKINNNTELRLFCQSTSKIFINDGVKENTLKRRAQTLFENNPNLELVQILCFSLPTQFDFENLVGLKIVDIEKISSIQPKPLSLSGRTGISSGVNEETRKKHVKKAFTFNLNYVHDYQNRNIRSNWWENAEIDTDGEGVYVKIDHFSPIEHFSNNNLKLKLERLEAIIKEGGYGLNTLELIKKYVENT